MQTQTNENQIMRNMRATVLAAMETGNHNVARTALRELQAVAPEQHHDLQIDVLVTYGILL